jgi:hypothetical protein
VAVAALAGACGTVRPFLPAQPFLIQGDERSAEVGYGGDPATTTALARAHCGMFERTARLVQAQNNVAYYDCDLPPSGAAR